MRESGWQQADIDLLTAYIEAGMSAATTATLLGRSRSGVCGKAARLGLHFKSTLSDGAASRRTARASRIKFFARTKAAPFKPAPNGGVSFEDRRPWECAYITDETPFAVRCCGASVLKLSVCAEHHKITRMGVPSNGRPKQNSVQSERLRLS